MSGKPSLPIDASLGEIVSTILGRGALVLRAEPGAGKTTRVPPALLDALGPGGGEVVVLEPRRLATRLAAKRVAEERGEPVGETVGYQVRFEDVTSSRTRLRFVTEGLLARRLASDHALEGVRAVILDEFHERSIHADTALALLERMRCGPRKDLLLVVMSATLEAGPIAAHLGAPVIDVAGRVFPVEVEHATVESKDYLDVRVRDAVLALCAEGSSVAGARGGAGGDILVFLPGAAEIARSRDALAPYASEKGLLLLPLHGSLSPEEQDRALRPAPRGMRKVILSTNVAETSVTIDGVTAVIDSGQARIAGHSPWSGLPTLRLEPIARASAAQRAGRAGRTAPGRCVRLYTRRDHDMRPAMTPPEITRLDLAETRLALAAAGVQDPAGLPWLEKPPAAALEAAEALLGRLGALDRNRAATALGMRLARLPLPPRLARVVTAGVDAGIAEDACAAAALLSDPSTSRGPGPRLGPGGRQGGGRGGHRRDDASDVLALLDDRDAMRAAEPTRRQLLRIVNARSAPRVSAHPERSEAAGLAESKGARSVDPETALLKAILAGHPDRVARRRAPGAPDLLLAEGRSATLAPESAVRDATWLVALDAEERPRGGALIRMASAIEPDWLIDLFPDEIREENEAVWVAQEERVDLFARMRFGTLVLDETRLDASKDEEAVRACLARQALQAGPEAFTADRDALLAFQARLAFARTLAPTLPAVDDDAAREALAELCRGRRSFAELRQAGLLSALKARLGAEGRGQLERLAPESAPLPSGRSAKIAYHMGRPPILATRMQDVFGAADGPRVGGGKVPVVLELLGPNGRPVQVTSDLAGFWVRTYPAVRRELCRKYPRHSWPEDPTTAAPEARPKRRRPE